MSYQPISDYALLSDSQTAALVDKKGSVDWWCAPTFDSPSVFARILDDDAGHFALTPQDIESVERSYLTGTLILRSTLEASSGSVVMTEGLAVGENENGHELGLESPRLLLRHIECTGGTVTVDIDFRPRFEYGLTTPLVVTEDDAVVARGGPMELKLFTEVALEVDGSAGSGQIELSEGEAVSFALHATSSWHGSNEKWSKEDIADRLSSTTHVWRSWSSQHQNYEGSYGELVDHSGRVLQGLTYRPTGAMVAAATTSLPEHVGGERNWDYRYCWIRDAGFTLRALWVAACPDEAGLYLDYLTAAATSVYERNQIQIVFGIDGSRDLSERELPWLSGWRDSAPVRVGNGAWTQPQHDVYGELLNSVHRLREQVGDLDDVERRFLTFLADRAAEVWEEPDHGIWEIRAKPDHYLHSKLMCWVALDRAVDMADALGASDRRPVWKETRGVIRDAIENEGWSEEIGSFTQVFGKPSLDASALLLPIVGFLPYDDERVTSTIKAIRRELVDDTGLVYRYRSDDGLPGEEGSFLLCTFWLAEALAGMGEVAEARQVFEHAISHRNDVDLLSEEIDSATGEMIGNFPQAFSHVGLINAAWAIHLAENGD